MKSPFAGMDPYIEACDLWEDFHHHIIGAIAAGLNESMPPGFVARVGQRSYIALVLPDGKKGYPFLPDVSVTTKKRNPKSPRGKASTSTMTLDQPVEMRARVEQEFRESFLEIYERSPTRRLVTTIEVLSPTNKIPCEGRIVYLRKRQALLVERRNLVELDLLRVAERMPMEDEWPPSPYSVVTYSGDAHLRCKVWPAWTDRPLPTIPIPLTAGTPEPMLALQPLVELAYHRARLADDIDYTKPLSPPLE